MRLVARWFITALALLGTAYYLIPQIHVASFWTAVLVAVVLGFVNLFFRPVLIILTLPINIVTLGLFTFVINGLLFWLVAVLVPGFDINATGWVALGIAMLGAFVVSVFSYIGNALIRNVD